MSLSGRSMRPGGMRDRRGFHNDAAGDDDGGIGLRFKPFGGGLVGCCGSFSCSPRLLSHPSPRQKPFEARKSRKYSAIYSLLRTGDNILDDFNMIVCEHRRSYRCNPPHHPCATMLFSQETGNKNNSIFPLHLAFLL